MFEWHDVDRECADKAVSHVVVEVFVKAEQWVQEVCIGVIVRITHVRAVCCHVVRHVVNLGPLVSLADRAIQTTECLVVLLVHILDASFEFEPLSHFCLTGEREVGTLQVGGLDHTGLVEERSTGANRHLFVTRFHRQVVLVHETCLKQSSGVVVGWD